MSNLLDYFRNIPPFPGMNLLDWQAFRGEIWAWLIGLWRPKISTACFMSSRKDSVVNSLTATPTSAKYGGRQPSWARL